MALEYRLLYICNHIGYLHAKGEGTRSSVGSAKREMWLQHVVGHNSSSSWAFKSFKERVKSSPDSSLKRQTGKRFPPLLPRGRREWGKSLEGI
jgi:hypothetical protein